MRPDCTNSTNSLQYGKKAADTTFCPHCCSPLSYFWAQSFLQHLISHPLSPWSQLVKQRHWLPLQQPFNSFMQRAHNTPAAVIPPSKAALGLNPNHITVPPLRNCFTTSNERRIARREKKLLTWYSQWWPVSEDRSRAPWPRWGRSCWEPDTRNRGSGRTASYRQTGSSPAEKRWTYLKMGHLRGAQL